MNKEKKKISARICKRDVGLYYIEITITVTCRCSIAHRVLMTLPDRAIAAGNWRTKGYFTTNKRHLP